VAGTCARQTQKQGKGPLRDGPRSVHLHPRGPGVSRPGPPGYYPGLSRLRTCWRRVELDDQVRESALRMICFI